MNYILFLKKYTRNINIVVITEVNEPYANSIYVLALILLGNALQKNIPTDNTGNKSLNGILWRFYTLQSHLNSGAYCRLSYGRDRPDYGESKYLWNVHQFLRNYMTQLLRRQSSTYPLPWEPEISPSSSPPSEPQDLIVLLGLWNMHLYNSNERTPLSRSLIQTLIVAKLTEKLPAFMEPEY